MIFFIPKKEGDDFCFLTELEHKMFRIVLSEWKRNVAPPIWSPKKLQFIPNRRCPVWKDCCTYVRKFVRGKWRYNYDLHYVNPVLSDGGTADVAFYVLKYMLKPSDREKRLQQALHLNLSEEEYEATWKVVRPRSFYSKHFGLAGVGIRKEWKPSERIVDYVRSSVRRSKGYSEFPCFFNPVDGRSFPLSRYYKNNGDCYTIGDALDFHYGSTKARADNVVIRDDVDLSQLVTKETEFMHKVNDIDFKQDSNDLDFLYE